MKRANRRPLLALSNGRFGKRSLVFDVGLLTSGFGFSTLDYLPDPFLHFSSSFIREGYAQDMVRCDPSLNQMCDATSDDSRLPSPCSGQEKKQDLGSSLRPVFARG